MRFTTLEEWLAWQERLHHRSIDLGLERVRAVYRRLNGGRKPHYTITVGGTNGKGSCVALLDTILREAGYRTAVYTSPHLLRYNERVVIDGLAVEDAPLIEAFDRIDAVRHGASLSYFEFGTLAALDLFARAEVDVQILEVGLGGRLDAVNIVDADAALIASIDLDHQEWLGPDRESIGHEKAGIFRRGRPAVLGDCRIPASVQQHALRHGVPLHCLGREFHWTLHGDGSWTFEYGALRLQELPPSALAGRHQFDNASAVLALLAAVRERLPVPAEAVRRGLQTVYLPGRYQVIPGRVPMLIDVAHNPQAAQRLAEYLEVHYAQVPIHAVFAVMRDKDLAGIVDALRSRIDSWHLAPLDMARAAEPRQLAEALGTLGCQAVHSGSASAAEAFAAAEQAADREGLVLVFGSFFLAAEFFRWYPSKATTLRVA